MSRAFHNYDAYKLRSPDDEAEDREQRRKRQQEQEDSADERNEQAQDRRRLVAESEQVSE